ncbi:LysR family transcriptional regulator [Acidovorax sp. Leaf84]|uniref:LysR family transcriptional regulator n=1 Tax=Acidovorax sp. Leaf84 TaxID=1736240 RepID=UPI000701DD1A|nr:LysR family transcriptional regulator [Acidovorax sp. Leaf84]KQO30275.1 LysR family transcriptional regulator [Acidovorax sp. Leaf84]
MTIALPPGADRIELMQTFIRIVETGSLSAAAQQLGTSQPTVSRRLQALERSLGIKLLQRSTHVMKLTKDGERCFDHAKALLEDWRAMEDDLRGTADTPRGTLRVLAPHAFGQDQFIAPLMAYLRRYPEVDVEWMLHDRRPNFIAEGIDCAIQVGAVDDPSVVAVRLAEVPRIVLASPALMAGRATPEHAQDLQPLPWLALSTFYRRDVTLTHEPSGEAHTFGITPRLATDSLYALRSAALAGLGACISSAWIVDGDVRRGDLLHLVPTWHASPLPVYLVYPYARFYPARLRLFLEAMRGAMPGLVGMRAVGVGVQDPHRPR